MSNYTKPAKEDATTLLLEAMIGGGPAAIERQEARGQQQLVKSDSIPSSWGEYVSEEEARERDDMLRQLGFEIREPFADDPLFRPATLPEGWKKSASTHAMHSAIIDPNGFHRIGIFYKAAHYDRKADMHLKRRIRVSHDPRDTDYSPNRKTMAVVATDKGDSKILILKTFERVLPPLKPGEDRFAYFDKLDKVEEEAKQWLMEHYPDCLDPLAYWDIDIEGEPYEYR